MAADGTIDARCALGGVILHEKDSSSLYSEIVVGHDMDRPLREQMTGISCCEESSRNG